MFWMFVYCNAAKGRSEHLTMTPEAFVLTKINHCMAIKKVLSCVLQSEM